MRVYQVQQEPVIEVLVSTPDAVFGRIYRVRGNVHRERGIVTAYIQPADAETCVKHWRAECYISPKSFSDELMKGIGQQLLAHTSCVEPLFLNICFGERTENRIKTFGNVKQDEYDES
jgi:hypothetical protein